MISRHGFCLLLLLNHPGVIQADEPAAFAPPQAYPASRYEAGWSKNPFTLKTVAPIAAQDSFARDLAIGAHYGAADNPTIVVVNTKTNERILLRKDQPAPDGMRLKSVHLSSTRTECRAEVEQGAEVFELTYDLKYLAQVSASQTSRQAAAKPTAGMAKKAPVRPPLPLPVSQATPAPPAAVVASRQFSSPQLAAPASPETSSALPARIRLASPPPSSAAP